MIWAFATDYTWIYFIHPLIVLCFTLRILSVRRPPGVALAWIFIVTMLPLVGFTTYLLIGERAIGRTRMRRIEEITPAYQHMTGLFETRFKDTAETIPNKFRPMAKLAEHHGGMPPMSGNQISLHASAATILQGIINDIEAAQTRCDVEFYIWNPGGMADQVGEALLRAAHRGTACRVLLDALGSSTFWKSPWPHKLRKGGVTLVKACAIHPLRFQFGRTDLRLHRKIVAIDQHIAWTGSLNLVDPAFFKQDAGVGEWIDAMTRVVGPAACALTTVFEADWAVESHHIAGFNRFLEQVQASPLPAPPQDIIAQAVPTGPSNSITNMSHILLSAILDAKKEVILTTPYFVPDDALFQALQTAACRGITVILIVPERVDSKLVRYASRSYMGDLLAAGVNIQQFTGGLLHTKSLVVDQEFTLFGSVNLDMRSLRLNYEITLMIYDTAFSQQVHALQQQYLKQSKPIDPAQWRNRSFTERLKDNAAQLMSPLL